MCLVSGAASFKALVLFLLYFFLSFFFLSELDLSQDWKGKDLSRFWGWVLKVHNNQQGSNLPAVPKRRPKELTCSRWSHAAKQMLWPICCVFLVAQSIWHRPPCTTWEALSCPACREPAAGQGGDHRSCAMCCCLCSMWGEVGQPLSSQEIC